MKLAEAWLKNGERMLIADDNGTHLLAQFHDLRVCLDELQQEFMLTIDLDKRVQLTLQMQTVIEQADRLIRSLTQRSKESRQLEKLQNGKSPGVTS